MYNELLLNDPSGGAQGLDTSCPMATGRLGNLASISRVAGLIILLRGGYWKSWDAARHARYCFATWITFGIRFGLGNALDMKP